MLYKFLIILCGLCVLLSVSNVSSQTRAFPTAEGYGSDASGGRGGTVLFVDSLADSGPGTLRDCMMATFARTCVFRVAGTIVLTSAIVLNTAQSNLTVAFQSAPYGGVQVRNAPGIYTALIVLTGGAENIIMRHGKLRAGVEGLTVFDNDLFGIQVGGGTGSTVNTIILDHMEISWSGYINYEFFGPVQNIGLQWSISCCAAGPEAGPCCDPDDAKFSGYGTITTAYTGSTPGQTITYHHNLFHDHTGRAPQLPGIVDYASFSLHATMDYRNNYTYAWTGCSPGAIGGMYPLPASGSDGPFDIHLNFVGNTYVANPAWWASGGAGCNFHILGGSGDVGGVDTKVYVYDNSTPYCPGAPNCAATEWHHRWVNDAIYQAGDPDGAILPGATEGRFRIYAPLSTPPVTTHPSAQLESILLNGIAGGPIGVGPRKPVIDPFTQQIFTELVAKSGARGMDGTWPDLTSVGSPSPTDSDNDGVPDSWETSHGRDPGTHDSAAIDPGTGYSYLELYLNFLAGDGGAPPVLGGTTTPIYVAQTGGTPATSCTEAENPATPFRTVLDACACMTIGGKTMRIAPATYDEVLDSMNCPVVGGTASTPTVIEKSGSGTVTIRQPLGTGATTLLWTSPSHSFTTVRGITFDARNNPASIAAHIDGPSGLTFEDSAFLNGGYETFFVQSGSDIRHLRSRFAGGAFQGVYFGPATTTNFQCDGCLVESNGTNGFDFISGGGTHAAPRITNTIVRANGGNGIDLGPSTNASLSNLLLHNNLTGLRVRSGAANATVDHVTASANTVGVQCDAGATTFRLRNSIAFGNTTTQVANNCTGTVSDTLTTTDPLFVNAAAADYHLQSGSPAINAGAAIGIPTDLEGTMRLGGPDLGAYEAAGTTIPPSGMGPLIIHSANPRYFQRPDGTLVYLTGAYNWNFFSPYMGDTEANAYLDQWVATGQNLIRAPSWDLTHDSGTSNPPYDTAYFTHIATRVALAQSKGLYVMVPLFWHVDALPTSNLAYNTAYAQKMVDVLGGYNNVLFEVGNELNTFTLDAGVTGSFTASMVQVMQDRQASNCMQPNPVGISDFKSNASNAFVQDSAVISAMLASSADFLVIGWSEVPSGQATVLPIDRGGVKVIFVDSDHIWPYQLDHTWVWRGFMRGHNMQTLDGNEFYPTQCEDDAGNPCPAQFDARMRMGDPRAFTLRMNMAQVSPQPSLSTSGSALADPGREYLVFAPGGGPFQVTLVPGTYTVEWFNTSTQATTVMPTLAATGVTTLTPPFAGNAVVYVKAAPPPPLPSTTDALSALFFK